MIKKIILLIIIILSVFGIFGCVKTEENHEQTEDISAKQLQEANFNCIDVETHDIIMRTDAEGTAEITVQLPDYKALYKEAYASANPDEYLLKELESGKYDTCEYKTTARVTIEHGKQVIHTDEAVKELLEQELSNAINALMEED